MNTESKRNNLAIIIPAYKVEFFEMALESIAAQSCMDFNLYIGIDGSPAADAIVSIIKQYTDKVSIQHINFPDNLGRTDLVAHWNRCIEMSQDEEWLWLFSDDDLMDPDCVAKFYQTRIKSPDYDLYHFNVRHVDDDKNINEVITNFPTHYSCEEFIKYSLSGGYSFVVEFVFRKSHFLQLGGFQNFDLAWYTDDATWIKLAVDNGIRNINSYVSFRTSGLNLTKNWNKDITKRKLYAQVEYYKWLNELINDHKLSIGDSNIDVLTKWFRRSLTDQVRKIPILLLSRIIYHYEKHFNKRNNYFFLVIKFLFIKFVSHSKHIVRRIINKLIKF